MLRRVLPLTSCLVALAMPASAQRTFGTVIEDFDHAIDDVLHVWTRPFHIETSDLPALGVVAGGMGLTMLADASIQDWVRDTELVQDAFEPFGSTGWIYRTGDSQDLLTFSAALYAAGFAADYRPLREAALGCASSDFANSSVRSLVYDGIARRRPSVRSEVTDELVPTDDAHQWDVPGGDWDVHSFFGGHAANVMSCVSFWNHRFDLGIAEPLLWGLAGAVGFARTVDENHWTSDTLLGMVFGWAIGRDVASRYARREQRRAERRAEDDGRSGIRPGDGAVRGEPVLAVVEAAHGTSAFYVGWRWRF